MVWAWERPENLEFLAGKDAGVAFLSSTVDLRGDALVVRGRRQPLRVAPATYLVAVVRVETSRSNPPPLGPVQRAEIVAELARAAALPNVRGVQIDFDAARSERVSYRALLREIRAALPRETAFTMTALASWCLSDRWLDADPPPVDEVVPMVFSMGKDSDAVFRALDLQREFPARLCRTSLGVSANERASRLSPRRIYLFNAKPWDEETYARVLARGP